MNHLSCFYCSFFDNSWSQISGQSESQQLHFGHLNVLLLERHVNKPFSRLQVLHSVTIRHLKSSMNKNYKTRLILSKDHQFRMLDLLNKFNHIWAAYRLVRTCLPAWVCLWWELQCSVRRSAPPNSTLTRKFGLQRRSPEQKK